MIKNIYINLQKGGDRVKKQQEKITTARMKCSYLAKLKALASKNKQTVTGALEVLIDDAYEKNFAEKCD